MPFCHIYARRDGRFTVRMHGTISRTPSNQRDFLGGTVEYVSRAGAFEDEDQARDWIVEGRLRDGLNDMPEPKVIRRAR